MRVGIGNPIIPGVGRPFIMDAGSCIRVVAGFGPRIPFGLPHGWSGARPAIIAAGPHYLRVPFSMFIRAGFLTAFALALSSISACALTLLTSCTSTIFASGLL